MIKMMIMLLKGKIKSLFPCKHQIFTEAWATKIDEKHYAICQRKYCIKCGQVFEEHQSKQMTRVELLKNKWFIEDCEIKIEADGD